MNKMRWFAMVGVVSALSISGAWANDPGGACQEDVKRLCGDVKPGGGGIRDCMKSHEADLSPGCKDKVVMHKKHFEIKKKEIETACQADIKQYCASVTPGEGREVACLKSYEDKISKECKEKLSHRMMKGKGMGKHMRHEGGEKEEPQEMPHP